MALLFLVVGEAAALHVLSTHDPTDKAQRLVTFAYVAGAVAAIIAIAGPRLRGTTYLRERAWLRAVLWLGWMAALSLLVKYADIS